MKMQSQVLGDIQDSLWKKREAERRERADGFNMQMELRKLDLMEEDQKYKREHAMDRSNPLLNPEAAARIEASKALTEQRRSNIQTPEEQELERKTKEADFVKKQADAVEAERNSRFLQASTENEQSSQWLDEINATDATFAPRTPEMSKTFSMAESLKKESAGNMKAFAPIAKPGAIPAPRPERPPTIGESLTIADRSIRPLEARVDGIRKQVDEAKKNKATITSQKKALIASGMTMVPSNAAKLKEIEELEKAADELETRDIDDRPVKISLNKAEEFLARQAEEAARRKAQIEADALSARKTSASREVKIPLPLPAGTDAGVPSAQNPMLPPPKTIDSIGLDPAQKSLFNSFFTAQPLP
jgi:uncharacterized phage infection (PIP) family protein YhgE